MAPSERQARRSIVSAMQIDRVVHRRRCSQLLARAHGRREPISALVCDAIHARCGELACKFCVASSGPFSNWSKQIWQRGLRTMAAQRRWNCAFPSIGSYATIWSATPRAPLTLRQGRSTIRELTQYRDLIQQRINFEEPQP